MNITIFNDWRDDLRYVESVDTKSGEFAGWRGVAAAAEASGYSHTRVYDLIKAGKVPAIVAGASDCTNIDAVLVDVGALQARRARLPQREAERLLAKAEQFGWQVVAADAVPADFIPLREACIAAGYVGDYGYQLTQKINGITPVVVYDVEAGDAQQYARVTDVLAYKARVQGAA